jgi:hypothetical protein
MAMVADADFVVSVTEVAVTVTVLPVGTADGAVYVVAVPLAVLVGLNPPQAPMLPQVTDQVTPAFAESLLTTAVSDVVALVWSEEGGSGLKATEIGTAAVMVMVADADFVVSVTEVAVTVTVLPVGTADGAVYVVAEPLAVLVELNPPQAPVLPQVTDQVTPAFAESLLTTAVSDVVALVWSEEGGVELKVTEIDVVFVEFEQPVKKARKTMARMLAYALSFIAPPLPSSGWRAHAPAAVSGTRARSGWYRLGRRPLRFALGKPVCRLSSS